MPPQTKKRRVVRRKVKRKKTSKDVQRTGVFPAERVGLAMIYVGFPANKEVIREGIAVVASESSFDFDVQNSIGATGGWQILLSAHPSVTERCAKDIICSTRYAKKLWDEGGGSFSPHWDASKAKWGSELYKAQFDEAATAALALSGRVDLKDALGISGSGIGVSIPNPVKDVASTVGDIVKLLSRLFEPEFWVRVGKAVFGAVALLIGVILLGRVLIGVDLGTPAERAVRGKASKVQESRERKRSNIQAAEREAAKQAARTEAKSEGQRKSRKQFFSDMEKSAAEKYGAPPF